MQISEILLSAQKSIPRLDAEVLLADFLKKSRVWLITHNKTEIENFAEFWELVKQRKSGKSVAAILGKKEFYGLEFAVDENVLIPRCETEILVEEILQLKPSSLLDVGCGSGCIAIAVAKNLPACEVSACDISSAALAIAKQNAENHAVNINFFQSDLLENSTASYEIIAANLPYISLDSPFIQPSVKEFEPHLALFGGGDGLELILKLLQQITTLPVFPRYILLEIGIHQAKELEKFIPTLFPTAKVEFISDLQNIKRVCKISLK